MHIKDHATAQGWFRRHAAAPSSKGSWKAFVARNNRAQEPRTMVQEPRTGFKEGNGVYDEKDLLGKRVRELMDEGYDFGEAVRQAMKEGYAEGGRIGYEDGQLVRNTVDGSRPGYKGKDVMPVRMTVEELHDFLGLEKEGKPRFNKIYRNLDSDAYLALNPSKVAQKSGGGSQWMFDKPSKIQAEEIMKIHVGSGGAQSGKIREATANAVRKLYKDKTFINFLEKYKKGDKIPTQVIRKIFSADGAYSPHIASTLGRILEGQLELEGIKVNKKLGAKIQQGMEYSSKGKGMRGAWHTAAYTYARNQLNSLDPSKSFRSYQNDITKLLKELNLPNMSVDEIQAIRTGHTGGTNPWSVFSQILTDKQNKFKGSSFDSEVSKKQIKLNNAIKKHGKNSQEVKNIITEQDEFVESFKNQHPEFKKTNLTRFDLRSPKQVLGAKVYNELPSGISDALDADFAKNKYSINVGEGALTQKQLKGKLEPITKIPQSQQHKFLKEAGFNIDKCLSEGGRVKLGGGGGVNTCIRGVIEAEQAKALKKNPASLKKFSKFGKFARTAGWFLGAWDIPIELAFALPHMLQGDKEAAKRATTLGLVGWGEKKLDEIKADSPEAYKYAKHVKDNKDWVDAWFIAQDKTEELNTLKEDTSSTGAQELAIDQLNRANAKMAKIQEEYVGYVDEEGKFDALLGAKGKTALQDYLREDVKKKADIGIEIGEDVGLDYNIAPYKGGQPITNVKQYIEQKGEPYWKSGLEHAAEEAGVADLYDTFMQGADNKDPRDLYSELPLEYASQLGKMEAEETRRLLDELEIKKEMEEALERYGPLHTRFAQGGIASLNVKK